VKGFFQGLASYGLWLISAGISAYCYLSFRGMNLLLMQRFGWNHHLINFMDKMAMLTLGLIVIAIILLIHHLYTEKSGTYFLPVTAIQLAFYSVNQFINLKLRNSLLLADYLVFAGLIVISCFLWYLYLVLKKNKPSFRYKRKP